MSFEDKQFQNMNTSPALTVVKGKLVLSGRPYRDTCIGHDDIINLNIALNTTNDVLDFLEVIK